jgi:UDP-N-acetylmuramate: L-alanyl-gamma-D-glutamyl-meso-diaminopimelate ligase
LLDSLPPNGILVANSSEPHARTLVDKTSRTAVFYSLEDKANWHADKIVRSSLVTFDLMRGGEKIVRLSTRLLGNHNIENIVGVSAMLLEKGLLSPDQLGVGINSFMGVKRRMELLSTSSTVPVFEGFGSSYDKAKSAIAAAKLHFPHRRLMVVFEPHTFTWRNREAIAAYDDVFDGAAKILIYEPASQGASTHAQLTQNEIVARVKGARYDAEAIIDPQEALQKLDRILESDDVVLLLTSGELGGLIKTIPKLAEQKYPSKDVFSIGEGDGSRGAMC